MPEIVKTLSFDETEIKFTGDGKQGIFEGYASVFNNTDSDMYRVLSDHSEFHPRQQ